MNYKKIGSSTQLTALRDGWTVFLTVSVMLVGMEIYPTLNQEETAVLWLPPRIPPCRLYLRFLKVCLVSCRRSALRATRKGMYQKVGSRARRKIYCAQSRPGGTHLRV